MQSMNDPDKLRIRIAALQDAATLAEIYAPYVRETAVSFEYTPPTAQEFAARMAHILERYPYIVAERDGEIIGYAYAGSFHVRAAYDWAAEATVYVRRDARRTGAGRALYAALEQLLALQGILNLNACIACTQGEDPYLTRDSICFHARMGYRFVGEFYKCGFKFGRWYNMAWMEKHIGAHADTPAPVKRFDEIRSEAERLGIV